MQLQGGDFLRLPFLNLHGIKFGSKYKICSYIIQTSGLSLISKAWC